MTQTNEIAYVAASAMQPTLEGFLYFESHAQARKQKDGLVDDIIFYVTTPGGGNAYSCPCTSVSSTETWSPS